MTIRQLCSLLGIFSVALAIGCDGAGVTRNAHEDNSRAYCAAEHADFSVDQDSIGKRVGDILFARRELTTKELSDLAAGMEMSPEKVSEVLTALGKGLSEQGCTALRILHFSTPGLTKSRTDVAYASIARSTSSCPFLMILDPELNKNNGLIVVSGVLLEGSGKFRLLRLSWTAAPSLEPFSKTPK